MSLFYVLVVLFATGESTPSNEVRDELPVIRFETAVECERARGRLLTLIDLLEEANEEAADLVGAACVGTTGVGGNKRAIQTARNMILRGHA